MVVMMSLVMQGDQEHWPNGQGAMAQLLASGFWLLVSRIRGLSRPYHVKPIGHLQGDGAGQVMIDMTRQGRDFSLLVQPKSRLYQNLWRLKLGLPSSLGAGRGCDCCKSRSRGRASCMLPPPGVHGPHPQAATTALRVAARGSVHAVPPGQCW